MTGIDDDALIHITITEKTQSAWNTPVRGTLHANARVAQGARQRRIQTPDLPLT